MMDLALIFISISNDGDIYETQKSNIVSLLEDYCDVEYSQLQTEGILIDGSAFVYSYPPQNVTFAKYSTRKHSKICKKNARKQIKALYLEYVVI